MMHNPATPEGFAALKQLALWLEEVTAHPMYAQYRAEMEASLTTIRDEVIRSDADEHKITKKRGRICGIEECLDSFAAFIELYGTKGTVKEPKTP